MNQILASSKIYVTKEIKRKQKFYKITFTLCVITLIILLTYYVFAEKYRNDQEAIGEELLEQMQVADSTVNPDSTFIINLSDGESEEVTGGEETDYEISSDGSSSSNPTGSRTGSSSGSSNKSKDYYAEAIFSFPRLNINYAVLNKTSTYLLTVALNKYWGPEPNQVGNYCIVGHNYTSGKMFGKLKKAQKGDEVKLTANNQTVTYKIYNIYVIEPTDVSCTSQLTNGKRELTLLTCTNHGKQRLCVKAREI